MPAFLLSGDSAWSYCSIASWKKVTWFTRNPSLVLELHVSMAVGRHVLRHFHRRVYWQCSLQLSFINYDLSSPCACCCSVWWFQHSTASLQLYIFKKKKNNIASFSIKCYSDTLDVVINFCNCLLPDLYKCLAEWKFTQLMILCSYFSADFYILIFCLKLLSQDIHIE